MSIDLYRLARLFEDSALLMELKGENKFKTKAYSDAADIIRRKTDTVEAADTLEKLSEIEGIGKALSEKILEFKQTGNLPLYENLTAELPITLLDLAKLKGFGPKRTAKIWKSLGVETLEELDTVIKNGSLEKEKGFGAKTVAGIKKNLDYVKKRRGHVLLSTATEIASRNAKRIFDMEGVSKVGITGEISLANDTVGCIKIVAGIENGKDPENIISDICIDIKGEVKNGEIEGVKEITSSSKKPHIIVYVCTVDDFFWVMNEHSMDKEFADSYHSFLFDTGWKINNGLPYKSNEIISFTKAADVYDKPGLQYVPQEIRSESQTIHFAANGYLPKLIELSDVKGLVHMHTTWSDGKNSTREMAEAAMARGLSYMLVTDHSQTAGYAGGLKPKEILLQHEEIDKLNEEYKGRFTILKGIESDILPDGSLDYNDEVLGSFDAVIGSVHGQFELNAEAQTDRIVNALRNPYMNILGHSTGRLLLRRPGYELDLNRIIDAAAEYGKVIEINANPHRLDLPWEYIKDAKTKGVKFSINPDAHNTLGIFHVEYGVKIARKGWLTAEDVINTKDSRGFLAELRKHTSSK